MLPGEGLLAQVEVVSYENERDKFKLNLESIPTVLQHELGLEEAQRWPPLIRSGEVHSCVLVPVRSVLPVE